MDPGVWLHDTNLHYSLEKQSVSPGEIGQNTMLQF